MSTNRDIEKAVVSALDHYFPIHRIEEGSPGVEIDSWYVDEALNVVIVDAYDGDGDIRITIEVTVERGE